jgi:hypothetical protein
LGTIQDIGEEHANILSDRHRSNNFLDSVDLRDAVGGIQFNFQLVHLTLFCVVKKRESLPPSFPNILAAMFYVYANSRISVSAVR